MKRNALINLNKRYGNIILPKSNGREPQSGNCIVRRLSVKINRMKEAGMYKYDP